MPFDIALTGLNAAQNDLQVISNNIANSETNGLNAQEQNLQIYTQLLNLAHPVMPLVKV